MRSIAAIDPAQHRTIRRVHPAPNHAAAINRTGINANERPVMPGTVPTAVPAAMPTAATIGGCRTG